MSTHHTITVGFGRVHEAWPAIERDLEEAHGRPKRLSFGRLFCLFGSHNPELLDSGHVERCRDCGDTRVDISELIDA